MRHVTPEVWTTPRALLDYLDACCVKLIVVYGYPSGERHLDVAADPHGALDEMVRAWIGFWARELIVALDRRRKPAAEPGPVPEWVEFGCSHRGNPKMWYPRPDGTEAHFWLDEERSKWRRY